MPGTDQWSAFTAPDPTLRLRTSSGDWLYLRATQRFHYADHPDYPGERKVVTDDYAYTLSEDDAGTELFSWQWHPGLWSDPHVHVGRGHPDHGGLAKLHIPTGRIAFEEVLKFAIIEYDLITPVDRDTALAQLDETLRRFRAFRQWH